MRIRPANRRPLLFGAALLATLAATWWAATVDEGAGVEPAAPRAAASGGASAGAGRRAPVAAEPGGLAVRRAPWPEAGAALMQAPPPPPAALAPPPPPPMQQAAPSLPFRFAGLIEERGRRSVILLEGREILILSAGERIDSRYRIDRITPTRVDFTYLPLRQRQSLDMADHDSTR